METLQAIGWIALGAGFTGWFTSNSLRSTILRSAIFAPVCIVALIFGYLLP